VWDALLIDLSGSPCLDPIETINRVMDWSRRRSAAPGRRLRRVPAWIYRYVTLDHFSRMNPYIALHPLGLKRTLFLITDSTRYSLEHPAGILEPIFKSPADYDTSQAARITPY
jgi:hypothetical protein